LDKNSNRERDLEGKELLAYFPFADSFPAIKVTGPKETCLLNDELKGTGKAPFIHLAVCMNTSKSFTDDEGFNRDMNKVTAGEIVHYNLRGLDSHWFHGGEFHFIRPHNFYIGFEVISVVVMNVVIFEM
jgi:hypothetical protein